MLEAILAIVAALIGVWSKKKINALEDEKREYKEALHEIDLAISTGNEDRVNRRLDSVLRRLSVAENSGDSGRQEDDPNGTGPDLRL
tara:strand:- start:968 stop:1228 length:261 start_codon:yes stop_codon:yes gene_type:complete